MNRELLLVGQALNDIEKPFDLRSFGRFVRKEYSMKISNTILKNYLWSYFRFEINYNEGQYTLKEDLLERVKDFEIEVEHAENLNDGLQFSLRGNNIKVYVNSDLKTDELVNAIIWLSMTNKNFLTTGDFVKRINQMIKLKA